MICVFCISICVLLINRVIPLSTWQLSDCETTKMSIGYEQLVAKPKAKNKVWRHFGFPAVAPGTIIDKRRLPVGYVRLLYHTPVTRQTWSTIYSVSTRVNIGNWWRRVDEPGIFDKPGPSGDATAKSVQISLGGAITRSALSQYALWMSLASGVCWR